MSTSTFASAVIPVGRERVWESVRVFTFPADMFQSVAECAMLDDAPAWRVGGRRVIKWESGEEQISVLTELDDHEFTLMWDLLDSNHPTEFSSATSTIHLYTITENDSTLITWETDFSSDVTPEAIRHHSEATHANLEDMRRHLMEKHRVWGNLVHRPSNEDISALLMRNAVSSEDIAALASGGTPTGSAANSPLGKSAQLEVGDDNE